MASLTVNRAHHQRIMTALRAFDPEVLIRCSCYFAGGTAIALLAGEHRESVDIDFLCTTRDGMRQLRTTVTSNSLGDLLRAEAQLPLMREVMADRYGVRTVVWVDGAPIKLELVHEDRIDVTGGMIDTLPVPVLSRTDLYAEKLLANTDRGTDQAVLYRDMIDLTVMINAWGPIPTAAWQKARGAYGQKIDQAFEVVQAFLRAHPEKWKEACQRMHIDMDWQYKIGQAIGIPRHAYRKDPESGRSI
ncbi:hypothetical protein EO087_03400 [Dyella sp. M7H15-1]|uniref:nucleotidyl transferase AbiEii/AbiGii toxin family protein n=1 Tax=Dyella sp. M7H15-1 TaxID=2501295 RepID=UPI001004FDCF|nr:nucleotidyl transferase AbiEii/AbiGii toxin family protein [Dyella sp. M7H15-1]QAU23151.1 hypothetical protein EO087_03400 [Dyella sp. M7H15-1]